MKKSMFINSFILATLIFSPIFLVSQDHIELDGDTRIIGKLDIRKTSGDGSVFIGFEAGASDHGNTNSTFVGNAAGAQNTLGFGNSFYGYSAGALNTEGGRNSFFGESTGGNNTSGNNNSFFGQFAGNGNTEGTQNVYVGANAGAGSTTANFNTIVGSFAGPLSTGTDNTFLGQASGNINTSGSRNVLLGRNAGDSNTVGNENTIIGMNADVSMNNFTNATALGFATIVDASNKVRIGNGNVTVIEGEIAFSPTSDRRLKEDIKKVDLGMAFINDLRPVQYHRINNDKDDVEMGVIAQELLEVLADHGISHSGMVNKSEAKGGYLSVRYNDLLAPMIKAIQELSVENEALKKEVQRIDQLEAAINNMKSMMDGATSSEE